MKRPPGPGGTRCSAASRYCGSGEPARGGAASPDPYYVLHGVIMSRFVSYWTLTSVGQLPTFLLTAHRPDLVPMRMPRYSFTSRVPIAVVRRVRLFGSSSAEIC